MIDELLKRIERLEYHQQLMFQLIDRTNVSFTKLIVEKNLGQEEVMEFHKLCDDMSKKLEEQKAEGFLYFHPLLTEFSSKLNHKLEVNETINACLKENLHQTLMAELKKYL
ncbi:YhaI family protein [Caldibacillus lycopersici]|uniref:YhaI family protein n=1 Tax=Perspicuibacillus lycopersici TaxID=1325689 RepID=A0AAE3IUY4_9BACI|nr:YhaI family protein [Perspicuibacillus lycopersici]MCU9612510.1 YhaI family protein [Perspicuibacillus lycopersici]